MHDDSQSGVKRPMVVHVIYRLAVGGLENGLVNLINHMPENRAKHIIVCITDFTDFAQRLNRHDVEIIAMRKRPGKDFNYYWRLWRLFRKLRPDIVHTRNLGAIDSVIPAWFAGVKFRVQGEHGRDSVDIAGSNVKYILFRRLLNPFVSHYIALSQDLRLWLEQTVGINPKKITQIYNGVDCGRFDATISMAADLFELKQQGKYVIGTVGRLQSEKNQALLVAAYSEMLLKAPELRHRTHLVIVGDGPDRDKLESLIRSHDIEPQVLMLGARNDVPQIMAGFDLFVLSSLIEGVSNTILEAMCMGLPVLATEVGGNRELVVDGETGKLVPSNNTSAMAQALAQYSEGTIDGWAQGNKGKQRVLTQFTMAAMVKNYLNVYHRINRAESNL